MKLRPRDEPHRSGAGAERADTTRALVHAVTVALLREVGIDPHGVEVRARQCAVALALLEWTGVELGEFPDTGAGNLEADLGRLRELAEVTGDPMLSYGAGWMLPIEPG